MDQRQNDQLILSKLEDMHEDIIKIQIRMAVIDEKVENVECIDAGTRLTKLESRNKYINVGGGILLSLVAVKDYLFSLIFG